MANDYRYELDADGNPLKASVFQWKQKGYDGFLGFGESGDNVCCEDCICADECTSKTAFSFPAGFGSFTAEGLGFKTQSLDFTNVVLGAQNVPYASFVAQGEHRFPLPPSTGDSPWYRYKYPLHANPWDTFWDSIKYPDRISYAENAIAGQGSTDPNVSPIMIIFSIEDNPNYIQLNTKVNEFDTEKECEDYIQNDRFDIFWDIVLYQNCEYGTIDIPNKPVGSMQWAVSLCKRVIDERTDKKFNLPNASRHPNATGTFFINDEYMSWTAPVWKKTDPDTTMTAGGIYCSDEAKYPYIIEGTPPTIGYESGGSRIGTRSWRVNFDKTQIYPPWITNNDWVKADKKLAYRIKIFKENVSQGGLDCSVKIITPLTEQIWQFTAGQNSAYIYTQIVYDYADLIAHAEDEFTEHEIIIVPNENATGQELLNIDIECTATNGFLPAHTYSLNAYPDLQDLIDTTQEFTIQKNFMNSYEFKTETNLF
jgi:hypothetical protein